MGLGAYTWWNNPYPRDDDDSYFECTACDDMGCPECCEPTPITLDDLDAIAEEIPDPEPSGAQRVTKDELDAIEAWLRAARGALPTCRNQTAFLDVIRDQEQRRDNIVDCLDAQWCASQGMDAVWPDGTISHGLD
jgi:hypothetical protein